METRPYRRLETSFCATGTMIAYTLLFAAAQVVVFTLRFASMVRKLQEICATTILNVPVVAVALKIQILKISAAVLISPATNRAPKTQIVTYSPQKNLEATKYKKVVAVRIFVQTMWCARAIR